MVDKLRILLAGEGGQGIQVIAGILTEIADIEGKKVSYLPNFGVEQRGGVSLAFIQISKTEIAFPKFLEADIVVVLAERAVPRVENYLKNASVIMFDNSLVSENCFKDFKTEKIAIPAMLIAKEKLMPRVFNTIILGALASELGFKNKNVKSVTLKTLKNKIEKKLELKHLNLMALKLGEKTIKRLKAGGN